MRVLLSGGGTAGHINPALAIAEIITGRYPDAKIDFVGTPHGMENRLVTQAGYPIHHVDVCGFSRSLSPKNLRALRLAITSPSHAGRILDELAPDIVIGTGGYVCYPILRAAIGRGIPTAIHESNALPGLTAKMLAPHVDSVWLNFSESAKHLSHRCKRVLHTGNPLRADFKSHSYAASRAQLSISPKEVFLLSFGGSLGGRCHKRSGF